MTIPDLDLLVARYGPEARVIEVIEAEHEKRAAQKAALKTLPKAN